MIIKIENSPLKNKRYRVIMDNDKTYDFGYKGVNGFGNTYIDHGDVNIRENYRKRHYANATEKTLIDNLVPSPSLFSWYILWGRYTNVVENINYLNNLWKLKHSK